MRKVLFGAVAALALSLPLAAMSAEEEIHLPKQEWSFNGVLGKFDKQQVQRGFQVYKEVCSACHSLQYFAFRNLADLGYSEAQVKTLAATYEIQDGPDDNGDMFKRKGKASDYMPKPFANDQAARASNGGALPPDLSLMTKAREGGPDYVYNLLLGYEDTPPAGVTLMPGMNYNKYFPGHQIGMAKQIQDGLLTYADGAPNDAAHIAKDVTAFLHWVAEPKLEARHDTGVRVILYTLLFTVLAYLAKRQIWSRIEH
ncbi:MAG: cytochrome c1 [Rhodospirillaceae bacterium]|nr:cytochrome c1 [Rhodospirillaceae bacterium]